MESPTDNMETLSISSPDQAPSSDSTSQGMSVEEKFRIVRSVGEECIQEDELLNLLSKKPEPVCYDGFEPSGRMHIAQDVKPSKEEIALTTKSSVPTKVAAPSSSKMSTPSSNASKIVSTASSGLVTEDEIRAVLIQKTPVTTLDLVAKFKSRLKTKEDKDAFAAILRRISKIRKTNGPNYVVLRDK